VTDHPVPEQVRPDLARSVERRGFACSGALSLEEIAETAADAEALGYACVWITVLRGVTNPVDVLESALRATAEIEIGLGLVPLDAFPAADLAGRLADAPARATIGLGVGQHHRGAAAFWLAGAAEFRTCAPGLRIAVGSYGPRVLQAAGACADSALLNWMTPERVDWAARQLDIGAHAGGRPDSVRPIYVYVPTASGPGAKQQLHGALRAMAAYEYHRRHQAALAPGSTVGVTVDTSKASAPKVPNFGLDAIPVINPTGESTSEQRKALLHICAPRVAA
jgi:alkanesulfonate monooxygenase SsuD/methylene tetrahydromethanopterin reductase-like flavin-dependent oxidoreductase (luciferase family)